jgi:HK97 family phage portal protein
MATGTRWRRWFGRSEERTLAPSRRREFIGGPEPGAMNPRRAVAISTVYAAVDLYVRTISTLPLEVFAERGEARERITGGRTVELLARPMPDMPGYTLVADVVRSLLTAGSCWVLKWREEERVAQLSVADPQRCAIEVVGNRLLHTIALPDGRYVRLDERDVTYIRGPLSLDGIRGLSPLAAAREALGSAEAIGKEVHAQFENSGRPSGVLKVPPGPTADEQMETLRAAWEARHAGPEKAGRVAVLSGEIGFQAVGLSARDAQTAEMIGHSRADIALVFGLPPWALAAPTGDSLTYSNVEGQKRALLDLSLRPWLSAIEAGLSLDRDLFAASQVARFNTDELARADQATRQTYLTAALNPETGWMTREEARRSERLPDESGTVPQVPPSPEVVAMNGGGS